MNFSGLTEYGREFRKLARKYKTLPEDMRNFRYVISSEIPINTKRFTVLKENEVCRIIKARLACKQFKNSSSALRVVFARYKQIDKIEFIEIYSKGDKDREDKKRIDDFLEHLPIDSS